MPLSTLTKLSSLSISDNPVGNDIPLIIQDMKDMQNLTLSGISLQVRFPVTRLPAY